MEKWALLIGYEMDKSNITFPERNIFERYAERLSDLSEVLKVLSGTHSFLLIVILWHIGDDYHIIKEIRSLTNIPIIVLVNEYLGKEKIAVLEAGADEYLPYPKTIWEIVASCRALIRRYTILNLRGSKPAYLLFQGGVLVDGDHRKVYVNGNELMLARREFEFFCLLASYPGRVFTYEQLFYQVWEVGNIPTENSVHSCIRRIRRKLEGISGCPCRIENVRGVGYLFRQTEL